MYQSYLLRIWRENTNGEWRASLSNVGTGELRHFPNITSLLAFICTQVEHPWPENVLPTTGQMTRDSKT
jgi:hypothetical protein